MFELLKKIDTTDDNKIMLWGCRGVNERDEAQNPIARGVKNILVIGGFHGDEGDGVRILQNFLTREFSPSPKNNLFIIPCLNPDGYSKGTRVNSNGVDLNRNFPTKNWELGEKNEFFGGEAPASEIETRFMVEVIEELRPDVILTIHAPFKIVNYDGDAFELSKKIAQIMNYPVQCDIGYPTPGSFGTYCGVERNIPTITLELGEDEEFASLESRCLKALELLASC